MPEFDVAAIVPSTRDLFQVIATRRRSLALVAFLDGERSPAEEAARLADANVSAFAFVEAGPAMLLAAQATKTVPTLCIGPARDRDGYLRARYFGADGVCVAASSATEWDKLAKAARSTRMLALALAQSEEEVAFAAEAGARALVLRASSAEELVRLAKVVPKGVTVVGSIEGATRDGLLAAKGHVDAIVVPTGVHRASDFGALAAELDP